MLCTAVPVPWKIRKKPQNELQTRVNGASLNEQVTIAWAQLPTKERAGSEETEAVVLSI